ncbi:alpha-(1,3)-fucosyltransferase c-like [Plakobranchus ocellatus]|uniref:Fucosyltransferase n=1 Tax=Plakobranchus ocellatus TaxID=259542 RepID=A0AAV4BWX0_9GAST|nr:alpha-(1,3)-fucosyltransferase c-like [Plakobranchus ocellatus]
MSNDTKSETDLEGHLNYEGPKSFEDVHLFVPDTSSDKSAIVSEEKVLKKHKRDQLNVLPNLPDDEVVDDKGKKSNELKKIISKSLEEFTATEKKSDQDDAHQRSSNESNVQNSLFDSPLVVTEEDWPLKKHLVPIRYSTSLGRTSSRETSATQPIKVAFIRNCIQDDPHCVEQKRVNLEGECPYPGLVQTEDWNSADIIVYSVWRIRRESYVQDIQRPPGQIWVMLSVEAPSRKTNHIQLDYPGLKGQFNLTMSYRLDSDIPLPYGYLQRQEVPEGKDWDAVYSKKRFHDAWLVSHCSTHSRREKYVRLLQDAGLEVHVYGKCGNYSCQSGRTSTPEDDRQPDSVCMPHISKSYFFYLSFENAMCRDYITEKTFKIFDPVDLIPVVMGGADNKKLLPPGTFVDVAEFASARDLAKYLIQLANDKERYLSMLREKHRWRRVARPQWYCALGEKLATGVQPKILTDTRTWYTKDQCYRPDDIG